MLKGYRNIYTLSDAVANRLISKGMSKSIARDLAQSALHYSRKQKGIKGVKAHTKAISMMTKGKPKKWYTGTKAEQFLQYRADLDTALKAQSKGATKLPTEISRSKLIAAATALAGTGTALHLTSTQTKRKRKKQNLQQLQQLQQQNPYRPQNPYRQQYRSY